jgi:hypothetical protein
MNKSYSKIRHIQESNKRLEKRLLKEDESSEMAQAEQALKMENLELASAGIPPISMETIEKFDTGGDTTAEENEISIVEPGVDENKVNTAKEQIRSKLCSASKDELKAAKQQILSVLRNKKNVQEQAGLLTILGITLSPTIWLAIAGFILILIIARLVRWLSNRDTGGYGCRGRESWGGLMRRINRPN